MSKFQCVTCLSLDQKRDATHLVSNRGYCKFHARVTASEEGKPAIPIALNEETDNKIVLNTHKNVSRTPEYTNVKIGLKNTDITVDEFEIVKLENINFTFEKPFKFSKHWDKLLSLQVGEAMKLSFKTKLEYVYFRNKIGKLAKDNGFKLNCRYGVDGIRYVWLEKV